ncbi:MAG TPA: FAD-dependent oxidoreductase, partial [Acidimicrobiia bacterium]|nr:FAD-dependent oxidoreductase [Acidimicrobiia bacterium]
LRRADPTLRVVVCERETVGFGASGRNGGWCSAFFAGARAATEKRHGRDAVIAMQRACIATLDEIEDVIGKEGIACDWARGGSLTVATLPAHRHRLEHSLADHRSYGFGDADWTWLDPPAAQARIGCTPNLGALATPHCAAIHPKKLVLALGDVVDGTGVTIHEHTAVSAIEPHRVVTDHGVVRAEVVVRATEAFTPDFEGDLHRALVPVYSLMIATEPLPASFWAEAGLADRATFADARHMVIYGQRTADDRFAFGGRGAPYHFGSKVRSAYDTNARVFDAIEQTLRSLFPAMDGAVTHQWGGAVAIPRDWYPSVGFDRATGHACAGGYVGDGVAITNLAGRTLADLVLGHDTELTTLPWVGHRSPRWEPEPLRWAGINAGANLAASLDRAEASGRSARVRRRLAGALLGH